ncbi:hypothetical protein JMN32_07350 [Fulvivirga sp. 29W222]|uniref:Uncharacterized protein n=1 Tax=Fulvivirga marina TaxID=2494733 RepID=A0A937KBG7_9BACT|nr:DUF6134 family protein [Fulvivirga marina]MBL6446117.1 hypothetical protein [Fulvivirga marina]
MTIKISVYVVLLVASLISVITTHAQKLIYRIDYKEDSIGYMIAKKSFANNKVIYELETKAKFKLILNFNHTAYYKAEYENNVLKESLSENFLNEKQRSKTTAKLLKGNYNIKKGDELKIENRLISESIAYLYFNAPLKKEIFSEKHGQFCPIRKVSQNKYELLKPDNQINVYHFRNGICDKVEVNTSMATVYLTRIK